MKIDGAIIDGGSGNKYCLRNFDEIRKSIENINSFENEKLEYQIFIHYFNSHPYYFNYVNTD